MQARGPEEVERQVARQLKREEDKRRKLAAAGIQYEFQGLVSARKGLRIPPLSVTVLVTKTESPPPHPACFQHMCSFHKVRAV